MPRKRPTPKRATGHKVNILAASQNTELSEKDRELWKALSKLIARQRQNLERISKRRLRLFLDSIPLLVVQIGNDQRVKFCNRPLAAFLGLRRPPTGKHIWEVFPPDYDAMRPSVIGALHGRKLTFEQSLRGKKERYFHATVTPDFELGDGGKGVFICLLDITERKALEERQSRDTERFRDLAQERAELLKRAREAVKVKDTFLATLSHELRTPLTAIVGWSALINSQKLSSQRVAEGMAAIERNAKSQNRLIEDLLDFSRMTNGTLKLEVSKLNIAKVVKETVDSLRPTFAERQLGIQLRLADDVPATHGDPERLQQVVMNLLSNAIKFTPAGGHIRVEVNGTPKEIEVVVEDDGQGIPQEFLPRIFEEFSQADMSSARRQGGLGLGLSIARKLVELHHGSIHAASPGPGRGSRFLVSLPAAS